MKSKTTSWGTTIAEELTRLEQAVRIEERVVEVNGLEATREFCRLLAEKRGIFHLHLKVFLGLFDLIGQVHDDWRKVVSSGKEPYSANSDAQIKALYQTWLALSGPARQKMEFHERHGPPFEKALHTHLHLVSEEVARIITDWQAPAAQARRSGARARKYSLAELLAGVTPENLHAEVNTGPWVGKEAW